MKINREFVKKILENKNNNEDFTAIKALLAGATRKHDDEDILDELFNNPESSRLLETLDTIIIGATNAMNIEYEEFLNVTESIGISNFESEKITNEEAEALDILMKSENSNLLAFIAREAIQKLMMELGQPFLIGQTNRGMYAYFVESMAEDVIKVCTKTGILVDIRDVKL